MKRLVIIGAGGHARVLAEAAMLLHGVELVGFFDDQVSAGKIILQDKKVLSLTTDIETAKKTASHFIVGIGNNRIRTRIFTEWSRVMESLTIIHPFTSVSPSAQIGTGTVVLPGTVISAGATAGINCLINAGCVIDHDSVVSDHVHLSRGTLIGSSCIIPAGFTTHDGQIIQSGTVL